MHYSNHSVDDAERNNNIARHHIASIHVYTTGKPSIGEHYTSAKRGPLCWLSCPWG